MFEKEAEEYRKDLKSNFFLSEPQLDLACQGFKDGAEYGYNKANEWHNLEKDPNDLPNKELEEKQLLARVRNYEEDYIFAYYMIDKYNSLSGKRFYSDISCDYPINKKDIIAWKEIVLPELKEIE
jgi:hypothetical protein